ncbi:hypothetical protein DFH94DRAFT_757191 [Russula ochroleuca]|uniref:Fungal lipase-type domain-containing protein n=1 Tax=Russula ochroleuca TaxID=152965 RepID=A0A9P5T5G3_9AGAM|nr:hypothetical protein DFH94DRAFT_757191 [Russula ochroleuca]
MRLDLPTIRGVTFGTRQVGSAARATFFDSQITQFTRVNNKRDPVPTVPGRLLGFRDPVAPAWRNPSQVGPYHGVFFSALL